ncbi:hypothetical protein BG74_01005 [Sodalis-like endosymbiont of Proechinophthirus fluctus]|nr:hypothetical protein BG74_01005 [Sodalis-like endosymbiont of Proechinophthirus fluctus]
MSIFAHSITALAPVLVFLTISLIVWIALHSSGTIMHVFSASGIEASSRLMGFFLVFTSVQFVINSVPEIIADYHA